MYFTAYYHKSGREWKETGTATWLALQMDFFRRDYFGDFLVANLWLTKLLTFGVVFWQGWGYVLFWFPIFPGEFLASLRSCSLSKEKNKPHIYFSPRNL
jgi:hypothetical protein